MFQDEEIFIPSKKSRMTENIATRKLYEKMYPLEQFAENLISEDDFFPNVGEEVYYRLNPALNNGTAFFHSRFWKKGLCAGIKTTEAGSCMQCKTSLLL